MAFPEIENYTIHKTFYIVGFEEATNVKSAKHRHYMTPTPVNIPGVAMRLGHNSLPSSI